MRQYTSIANILVHAFYFILFSCILKVFGRITMKQNNDDLILGWGGGWGTKLERLYIYIKTFYSEVQIHRKLQRNVQEVLCTIHLVPPKTSCVTTVHYQNWETDTGAIYRAAQICPALHAFICLCACACKQFWATLSHVQLYVTTTKNQNGLTVPPPQSSLKVTLFTFLIATPPSFPFPIP